MRHASAILLAAAALLAGCGQPFLSAQVEIPEIRILEPGKVFPPASVAGLDPSAACTFLAAVAPQYGCAGASASYDLGAEVPVVSEKGVTVDLRLTDLALHLEAGTASDLRGVLRAQVDVRDPATGAFTKVASYVRPPGATPTTIAVSGSSNLDLSGYLSSGKIDARVEVEMDPVFLPSGFSAALEAGFSLVATLRYSEYL